MPDTPTHLPPGWRVVRFGDVVREVKVKVDPEESGLERYVAGEHMATDDLHIRSWGTIGDGYLGPAFHRKFVTGQVLYGSRRTYLRKVAVAEFDGVCANTTFVMEPANDDLLPELLPFIMQTEPFTRHSIGQSRGSTNPYITWKDLAWYEFPLPPRAEQQRIAELLWAADESIWKTLKVQEELLCYKQVLMRYAFSPSFSSNGDSSFIEMPLTDVLTYASDGPFGSKLKTAHYTDSGARVIRLQNIRDGYFDDGDKAYISREYFSELSRYSLEPDDVVVAGLGDETYPVGRACLIPTGLGPAINKADCFCLRADGTFVAPEYLAYFLNSPYARHQINQRAQGSTRMRINVSNLKTVTMEIPDRDTQLQVCKRLDAVDRAYVDTVTNLQTKRELLKSLREHLLTR